MGLEARVAQLRAARYAAAQAEAARGAILPSPLAPKAVSNKEPALTSTPPDQKIERIFANEITRLLEHFEAETKLQEIRTRYWGCGELNNIVSGFKLSDRYDERIARDERAFVDLPYSPGYTSHGDSGRIVHSSPPRAGWSGWANERGYYTREVRPTLIVQVVRIYNEDVIKLNVYHQQFFGEGRVEYRSQICLVVALEVDPLRYLQKCVDQSFDLDEFVPLKDVKIGLHSLETMKRRQILTAKEIAESLATIEGKKYQPAEDRRPFYFNGKNALTATYSPKDTIYPSYHEERDYSRNFPYGSNDLFYPWAIFLEDHEVDKFDGFLANYIVDLRLDQRPISTARELARVSMERHPNSPITRWPHNQEY